MGRKRQGKPGKPARTDATTIEEWLEFHSADHTGLALAGHPEVTAELERMLRAIGDAPVVWARVAAWLRKRYPDAPRDRRSYRNYAERRLGWEEGTGLGG